jgi:hypothetical protein
MLRKLGSQPQPTSLHLDEVRDFIRDGLKKFTGVNDWVREEFKALANQKWHALQEHVNSSGNKDIDFSEPNPIYLNAKLDVLRDVYFDLKTKIVNFVPYLQKLEAIKYKLALEIARNPQIWGEDIFDKTRSELKTKACPIN